MSQSSNHLEKTLAKVDLPPAAELTLSNFQKRALRMFPDTISRIILYGSYARGQATPESDLDVMVVVRREKQPTKSYIGGPGDIRWTKLIDAAIDSLVNQGPFVSVLVVGEDIFQSKLSVSQAAREEGLVLWTAQPT
jgi:hypothetical protein